jgi:hypothetical protein
MTARCSRRCRSVGRLGIMKAMDERELTAEEIADLLDERAGDDGDAWDEEYEWTAR